VISLPLVMPSEDPTFGAIRLRAFAERDAAMLMDLATDPYLPLIGTLPGDASRADAVEWIRRQHARLESGAGYSYCVADLETDQALATAGLHLGPIAEGRATAGYAVAPRSSGRGVAGQALQALTAFGWTIPAVHRVELYIEPWNLASLRTAARAGYEREGLLRRHQEIGGRRVDMVLWAAVRPATEKAGVTVPGGGDLTA
jgi:RimJ/RimL family protein N-acetyltransferase